MHKNLKCYLIEATILAGGKMAFLSAAEFRPENVLEIDLRSESRIGVGAMRADLGRLGKSYARGGPAMTLREPGGQIVACVGILSMWPGVAEAWCLASPLAGKWAAGLTRAVLWELHLLEECRCLHRIQAHVRRGRRDAVRWLEYMGFEFEGLCLEYGSDREHYYRYARSF